MNPESCVESSHAAYGRALKHCYSRIFWGSLHCASLALLLGCGQGLLPDTARSVPNLARPAATPAPLRAAGPLEPALHADTWWQQAASGDDLDLARLARREGAHLLLQRAERGGREGYVALSALPFAPDARGALTRACAVVFSVPAVDRAFALSMFVTTLTESGPMGENLDLSLDGCASAIESARSAVPAPSELELSWLERAQASLPVHATR
ncbi:MAG: hypothetical protein RJA70_4836 [Pseudomonadota bacterium]